MMVEFVKYNKRVLEKITVREVDPPFLLYITSQHPAMPFHRAHTYGRLNNPIVL
ncbi:MAG TPA: hypothetical protein VLV18_03735 [Terriglobales bacterium]|nr:hypothetical protein [Terriglobales bacterium]